MPPTAAAVSAPTSRFSSPLTSGVVVDTTKLLPSRPTPATRRRTTNCEKCEGVADMSRSLARTLAPGTSSHAAVASLYV
eukprot:CAMPEP_0114541374 /NCGR_PEP_ID=MMETSP0114-20121206/1270_1 /TAXON_ID=31324 /ORGANISM="Goniomonas sp, Strain m" /LENGTH=78 /DNA_ID=CAMNT_0001725605 /DNA_START=619 /DNA_END=855 /DNA_ORIENTATION=-